MNYEIECFEKFTLIMDNLETHLWIMADAETYGFANKTHADFLGKRKEELVNKTIWELLDHDTAKTCFANNLKSIENREKIVYKKWVANSQGKLHFFEVTKIPVLDDKNKVKYILCKAEDITKYSEKEKELRVSEEQYRAIVESQLNLICRFLPDGTLTYVNKTYCDYFGKSYDELVGKSFLALVPEDEHERIRGYLSSFTRENPTITYEHKVMGPNGEISWQRWTDQAFFDDEGNIVEFQSVGIDITELKLKEEDLKNSYNKMQIEIAEKNRMLLRTKEDLIREINERKAIEVQLKDSIGQLKKSLNSIIDVILNILEIRDPYTNNHQARVAYLAYNIGKEMGLSEQQLSAIYIAGILHDIGKIYIPSDILNKPGKLNEVEFSLIKMHSEIGYEILNKISFPCPVAQIVLQHHERIDGSGYPNGLKGDEILPEAKVIAVADVVEAMSSHRPYRPALGIEIALNEIERHRGKYYDTDAVDACIRLFKEKDFAMNGTKIDIAESIKL